MKNRIEKEKKIVAQMIHLYCRHHEGNTGLCPACSALLDYAIDRLSHCPFGNSKPTCRKCKIHCYRPDMKKRIKTVMRWSGPRMMLHHPVPALLHIFRELK